MHITTETEMQVGGYYTFILNGVPVFEAPSKNLITDFGWSRLFALSSTGLGGLVVQVGTSNTPPTVTDTVLGGLLASKVGATEGSTLTNGTDTTGTYQGNRYAFAFVQGAVVGNVAEVGFKVADGDSNLTSRSLVKDGSGNPAVIVVTAIDQLTVQYELRYYLNQTLDTTGTVTVAGTPTSMVLRAASQHALAADRLLGYTPTRWYMDAYGTGFSMGGLGVDPAGPSVGVLNQPLSEVVATAGTGTVTFTCSMSTALGNASGGIFGIKLSLANAASIVGGHFGAYKISFSPPIPKNSTKTLAFTFTLRFVRV